MTSDGKLVEKHISAKVCQYYAHVRHAMHLHAQSIHAIGATSFAAN